jgi:hypothetical protein
MTAVSHFRNLRVDLAGLPSFVRSTQVLRGNAAITTKTIPGPHSYLNFGTCGFVVQPITAAISATRLTPLKAAETGAWTDDTLGSFNSIDEGGMA